MARVDFEDLLPRLVIPNDTKIVLVVIDGLGGVRTAERTTELTEARTPNLDLLAAEGSSGVHFPVLPGITPGSGTGHLALFGYDPLKYQLGRGALSAAGLGFDLKPGDVAARVNFCTLDDQGIVTDRRAGRIATQVNAHLCEKISGAVDLGPQVEFFLQPERDHRALLVLRGDGLSPQVTETDPQMVGIAPHSPEASSPQAVHTAQLLATLLSQVRSTLADEAANFILLRGYDTLNVLPGFHDRYRLNARGIAAYPMYLGIARILGMATGEPRSSWEEEVDELSSFWKEHDFFFIHHKPSDSAGEDGDFAAKVTAIEQVDATIARIMAMKPDVICITGDHSTPSPMRSHSWHPVPLVMHGESVGVDGVDRFNEVDARAGGLGQLRGKDLMPLMLAAAGRLAKMGA